MEVTWLGHSCFRLKGKEAVLITDPFDTSLGYSLGKPSADIVTVSHPHPNHANVDGVGGTPHPVEGPGEYEISGVFISSIRTFHDDEGGRRLGKNTVYVIEMDDLRVCHLGDLGHVPSSQQVEEISPVDILLVPVGGVTTIGAAEAAETIGLLDPKIVVPMHYRTEAIGLDLESPERFLKEMGLKELAPQPRLMVTKSNLPEVRQVILLDYRR
ncbi:MAG: MBL fold metallo-hydrolase [Chloroflexota bacterium]